VKDEIFIYGLLLNFTNVGYIAIVVSVQLPTAF